MKTTNVKAKLREEIVIETGKMAKQADGAVMVSYGGTVVLVTVVSSKIREGIDFFPLSVDYREKTSAAGKIPGGFFKREGRPSEKEILTARLVDRPIRPLFPKGFKNEVQIMASVLSSDSENDSDVLAMVGASAALSISDIPFLGPIGAVRIGKLDGELVVNPTFEEVGRSTMDVVVTGTKDAIVMIEAGCKEVSEEEMSEAIAFGQEKLQGIIEIQNELVKLVGKEKFTPELKLIDEEFLKKVRGLVSNRIDEVYGLSEKEKREEAISAIGDDLVKELVVEGGDFSEAGVRAALVVIEEERIRELIVNKKTRVDGRGFKEIRDISCEVSLLPRTHGSALFTRGQTQSLSVATLGTSSDEQRIDALEGESLKSFMLHYNFPPFSVGEVKPVRGPGRREIGHGALAERALKPIIPSNEEFPYTIRLVSDILESNGSSSMATVCAGTLALMDAGVPISKPVSGIAMGLIKQEAGYAILTDIAGVEDHFGDMDFKVTGTRDGITAMQMDLKVHGISNEIIRDAFQQAKEARLFILDKMEAVISSPGEISKYAPKIVTLKIDTDKIRDLIGPGGKMIRKIIQDTGVSINVDNDGTVTVASANEEAMQNALDTINGLTQPPEVNKVYKGTVVRIMPFGAFCNIGCAKEGLVHVSELSNKYVEKVEEVVKVGDEVSVKVLEIDKMGRINLSMKQAKE